MNVAITRAKKRLVIFADSATIGNDPFYKQWIEHFEKLNAYHSAFELMYS
jgi:superfamily I DNA and/or RNA helicase